MVIRGKSWTKHGRVKPKGGRHDELKGIPNGLRIGNTN